MISLESEKRFLLLLSSYCCYLNSVEVTKENVLNFIERHELILLDDRDLELRKNRNEEIWRNDIAFVRKHLVQEGLYDNTKRNCWQITELGLVELQRLYLECKSNNLKKIAPKAIEMCAAVIK